MCGGVVMSGGKGKSGTGIKRIIEGIASCFIVCFFLISLWAWMVQKGTMGDQYVVPLLSLSVFIASLTGCIIACQGGKGRVRTCAAAPGIILAMMIVIGRWIGKHDVHDLPVTLLFAACSAVPALIVMLRHPRKRRG